MTRSRARPPARVTLGITAAFAFAAACSGSSPPAAEVDAQAPATDARHPPASDAAPPSDAGAPTDDAAPPDDGPPTTDVAPTAGADDAATDAPPTPGARSYVVTATLERDPRSTSSARIPASATFSLHLTADSPPRVIASGEAGVLTAELTVVPGGWRLENTPFRVHLPRPPGACPDIVGLNYYEMEIALAGDGIRGTLKGEAESLVGSDVAMGTPIRGTFVGTPDHQPPQLHAYTFHPADRLDLFASEALPIGTQAALLGPDGTRVPLEVAGIPGDPPVFFYTKDLLGLRAGYRVVLSPRAVDLAGNAIPAEALPTITSPAIPLLAAGDFEGGAAPFIEGMAAVVGADRFPPISGQRSLYLSGDEGRGAMRASFRVRLGRGKKRVRLTVRAIVDPRSGAAGTNLPSLMVVAPDGSYTQGPRELPSTPLTKLSPTLALGGAQPLQIDLPPGATDEVLLDFQRGLPCTYPLRTMGLLLDDVTTE